MEMAFALQFAPLSYCSPAAKPMMPSASRQYRRHPICDSRKFDRRCLTAAISSTPVSNGGKLRSVRCFAALTPELKTTLDKVVTLQKILKSMNVPFETINILENEMLRQGLKEYSSWPTFPQVYIDGEFFGGCDITVEAYQSGELQEVLEKAMCS